MGVSNLKIVLKTKDEDNLIEPWLLYHSKIVGWDNLIVFDNNSTSKLVKSVYEKYKYKGFELKYIKDDVNILHNITYYSNFYSYLRSVSNFFIIMDTDEFLTYYNSNENKFDNTKINEKLINISNQESIISMWIHNTPNFGDISNNFKLYELNSNNLRKNIQYGKQIIGKNNNIFTNPIKDFKLSHSMSNSTAKYLDNFIILHNDKFDINNRIKNNINLLKNRIDFLEYTKKHSESLEFLYNNFDIIIKEDIKVDDIISKLDDINQNIQYHKLQEIINYFSNKKSYMKNVCNYNLKFYLKTNIIESTIQNIPYTQEICYDGIIMNGLTDVDFYKNILI